MDDLQFFNSFIFNEFKFTCTRHNDISCGNPRHYIGYLKQGTGLLISDDRRVNLEAGDLFYIPKGCKYNSYWIPKDSVVFDSFGFEYMPKSNEFDYELQKVYIEKNTFEIYEKLSANKKVDAYSVGLLYTLLFKMQQNMAIKTSGHKNIIISEAINYMEKNPQESIYNVAKFCKVSETTLYNTFKKVLKKTPNTARQEINCKAAIKQLTTTVLSVEEISQLNGFSSSSYFRKVLKQQTGKTPSQIRKSAFELV